MIAPAIHAGNTRGFVNSIAPEVRRERLIIIDNTEDGLVTATTLGRVRDGQMLGRNVGVAASWNLGMRQAFGLGAEYVTICSTSLRFRDGAHGLCATADVAAERGQWPWGFESMNGWRCVTLTKRTVDEVGWFDEEFWPGYYEDNDYIHRLRLAGLFEPLGGDMGLRKIPWVGALEADVVEDAHAIKHVDGLSVDFVALERYYVSKWGGKPGEEKS